MAEIRLADLLWAPPTVARRGPRRRVDLATIVAAAVLLADAEGLEAASMQRVADDVGLTKMALYRYVPGRAELVALMIEAALGAAPVLAGDWPARLRGWADAMRAVFARHRWLAQAAAGGRLFGPVELGWLEAGLAAVEHLPLSATQRLDTLVLVGSHVRGIVQQEAGAHPEQTIGDLLAGVLESRADRFPLASRALAESAAGENRDSAYEFGLDRIIDGIEALVGGPQPRSHRRRSG